MSEFWKDQVSRSLTIIGVFFGIWLCGVTPDQLPYYAVVYLAVSTGLDWLGEIINRKIKRLKADLEEPKTVEVQCVDPLEEDCSLYHERPSNENR